MRIFAVLLLCAALAQAQEQQPVPVVVIPNGQSDPTQAKMSITPRLVRDNPVAQAFFEDSETLYITSNSTETYNRIMNALTSSLKTHSKVDLIVNRKTKTILDVQNAPPVKSVDVYDSSGELIASPPQAEKPAATDKNSKKASGN